MDLMSAACSADHNQPNIKSASLKLKSRTQSKPTRKTTQMADTEHSLKRLQNHRLSDQNNCCDNKASPGKRSKRNVCWEGFLVFSVTVLINIASIDCVATRQLEASANCVFPQQWNGSWFQSGEQQPITFSGSTMSSRGRCVASEGDKYLLVNEKDCKRCVVIYEKHQNVLQYKESECELEQNKPASAAISSVIRSDYNTDSRFQGNEQYLDPESGRELLNYYCEQIPGDAMLFSMFKIDSEPVKCPPPLKGQFAFTYNRGHGECKSPVSKIKSCTEDTRMMLNFQACPDVEGTESTVEELTCLATWKDNSQHFIVGSLSHSRAATNEERFRCFVYEKINTNSGKHAGSKDVEYRLAQSGDATCSGLENSEYGSRIMTLKRFGPAERCDFPKWFKEPKHWHSLNGELSYNVHQKNDGTIHITKEKPTQRLESRAVCEQINKQTANETIMVVEQTTGCNTGFLCLVIYRRDTHVVELQIGNLTSRLEDACAPDQYDVSRTPFTTLLAAASSAESQECPLSGSYTLTGPLGPPYMMSRHKRNHINGSKQHHHSAAHNSPSRHDVLSFRNSDLFEHSLHPHDRLNSQRHRRDLSKCLGTHKQRRRLSIGCSRDDIVEVHPQCSESGDEEYVCHGSWTENDTTFIIARHAGTKHGVCISFKPSTTDSTAAQLIVGDSCYRETMSSEIPEHHLISNVTGIVREYFLQHRIVLIKPSQASDTTQKLLAQAFV